MCQCNCNQGSVWNRRPQPSMAGADQVEEGQRQDGGELHFQTHCQDIEFVALVIFRLKWYQINFSLLWERPLREALKTVFFFSLSSSLQNHFFENFHVESEGGKTNCLQLSKIGLYRSPSKFYKDRLFRCASISCFQVVSEWITDTFSDLQSILSLQSIQSQQSL